MAELHEKAASRTFWEQHRRQLKLAAHAQLAMAHDLVRARARRVPSPMVRVALNYSVQCVFQSLVRSSVAPSSAARVPREPALGMVLARACVPALLLVSAQKPEDPPVPFPQRSGRAPLRGRQPGRGSS